MQIGDTDNVISYLILTPTPKKPKKLNKKKYTMLKTRTGRRPDLCVSGPAAYIRNIMYFCICVLHVANPPTWAVGPPSP